MIGCTPQQKRPATAERLVLAALALAYAGYGLLGYGNDNDTYHMLDTWNRLVHEGRYEPSRGTGYLVPELAIGLLSRLGGHYLSNLASVGLAVVVLALVHRAALALSDARTALLAMLVTGLHPYFFIAASTSMDYLYALAGFAAGLALLLGGRPVLAAFLFAAGISARITYAVPVPLAYLAVAWWHRHEQPRVRRHAIGLALAGLLSALTFVPSFLHANGTLGFLTFSERDGFSLARAGGNFVLHHLSFWGLPALVIGTLFFVACGPRLLNALRNPIAPREGTMLLILSAVVLVWFELFFLRLPAEPSYLLPALPALVLLMAFAHRHLEGRVAHRALSGLLVAFLVQSVVSVTFFELRGRADPGSAIFERRAVAVFTEALSRRSGSGTLALGVFIEEGPLLHDLSQRGDSQRRWTEWLRDTWPGHPAPGGRPHASLSGD